MATLHMKDSRDYLALRVIELRDELSNRDPAQLAAYTGAAYTPQAPGQGEFRLALWDQDVILDWPDFIARDAHSGTPLSTFSLAMLAYYFHTSDGLALAGTWIAFTDLPDGSFYTAAFQGYTGSKLVKHFGNDLAAFQAAAQRASGQFEKFGDAAYAFQALPRVYLLAVGWQGDEDFAPSYRILFDANASHHMTTDACAILGSSLTKRLINEAN